jgi:hypothetical protein
MGKSKLNSAEPSAGIETVTSAMKVFPSPSCPGVMNVPAGTNSSRSRLAKNSSRKELSGEPDIVPAIRVAPLIAVTDDSVGNVCGPTIPCPSLEKIELRLTIWLAEPSFTPVPLKAMVLMAT